MCFSNWLIAVKLECHFLCTLHILNDVLCSKLCCVLTHEGASGWFTHGVAPNCSYILFFRGMQCDPWPIIAHQVSRLTVVEVLSLHTGHCLQNSKHCGHVEYISTPLETLLVHQSVSHLRTTYLIVRSFIWGVGIPP